MERKTAKVSVPNEIAQNLKTADEDAAARYDASARNLVAEKPVLAYILKSSLDEYAGYSVQEIAEKFIEGEPEVRQIAVHQDHPDRKAASRTTGSGLMSGDDKVEGLSETEKSQREGTVYYDIRFLAVIPQSGELAEVFVNCEIQNNDTPGYPIPKRGIYYAARMISAQRGKVFKDQDYGKMKKVVTIWVCEDTADFRSDTVNRYSFTEECLRGSFHEDKENYDLMDVVVLRLGRKGEDSGDDAIRLLSRMFSLNLAYEEKLETLQKEFRISVTKEISREVLEVCNLSTGVYNKGYDSGVEAGRMNYARETAYELQSEGMPLEKMSKVLKVDTALLRQWLAERAEAQAKP